MAEVAVNYIMGYTTVTHEIIYTYGHSKPNGYDITNHPETAWEYIPDSLRYPVNEHGQILDSDGNILANGLTFKDGTATGPFGPIVVQHMPATEPAPPSLPDPTPTPASAETAATIALQLAQEMAATKLPNAGPLQLGSPIAAADVVSGWMNVQPESVNFLDMPAWDATTTHHALIDASAIGAELCGISYLVSQGISLDTIAESIAADSHIILSTLLPGLWDNMIAGLKARQWPHNNDPFGALGVRWPVEPTISQRIYDLVMNEIAKGIPEAQIVAQIQDLLTPAAE